MLTEEPIDAEIADESDNRMVALCGCIVRRADVKRTIAWLRRWGYPVWNQSPISPDTTVAKEPPK